MTSHFTPDLFAKNRAQLRASVHGNIPIVITGNGAMQRGGDEPAAFFQDSNFWYLTGLNGTDLTLVIGQQETYVIVPSLSASREAFDGAHNTQHYETVSGITTFLPERAGWEKLRQELAKTKRVATCAPAPTHMKSHGVYALPFRRRLSDKLKRMAPGLAVEDVRATLASMRVIKQPAELQALQRAIDITGQTLQEIATSGALQQATHEYQLEAALSYGFRGRAAAGHAFAPIVAAGKHATTLHYMENNGPIGKHDAIVLDVGAEVDHYAADISRTVSQQPMKGRVADVFHAVEAVQDYALSLIRPGTLYRDYEQAVEAYMGKQLQKLGLITTADHAAIRRYFPHATSHFLGLDTHDVGDYRAPWEAGMVITCEPGIYIPEEGIGVRLEDDVLITASGYTVLSAACPRALTPVQ